MKWLITYNENSLDFVVRKYIFLSSIYLINMVEKFQGVSKTVFGNVSEGGEILYKYKFESTVRETMTFQLNMHKENGR